MDEWRSMVVVNLLRRCPNLSKHELRELAAHFESRLPVAQPEQKPVAWVKEGKVRVGFGRIEERKYVQFDQTLPVGTNLHTAPPSKPINFLVNGTRYKVTHQGYYGCSIVGLPENLNGQWVALVDATDDKHLQYTAPPSKPWVSLTDEEIEHEWVKWKASVPRYYGFAKGIEAALRSKNNG